MEQDLQGLSDELKIFIQPYLENEKVQSMTENIQHGDVTTYAHSISVMLGCYKLVETLHLNVDEKTLLLGALLHDFYLYDWHNYCPPGPLHGFSHPFTAQKNAVKYFQVDEKIQHMIQCHMWPLTLRHIPKTREAVLLCMVDKWISTGETVQGFAKVIGKFLSKKEIIH